eukprot:SAG31_NODE_764_length_12262_cov_26.578887_7_plen_117_part_00
MLDRRSGELQGDEEENVVRGDKGKKKKMSLTSSQYARRSFKLAHGQLHIVALAMIFLIIASSAGILLPNYQGQVLDSVIRGDPDEFRADRTYIFSRFSSLLLQWIRCHYLRGCSHA